MKNDKLIIRHVLNNNFRYGAQIKVRKMILFFEDNLQMITFQMKYFKITAYAETPFYEKPQFWYLQIKI